MSDPDELQFDALTPMSDPDELQFDALTPSLGAELTGVSAQSVASALHDAPAAAASQALARQLAQLLRARSVVVLRGQDGGELVGPAQLRAIYTAVHRAMGMTCAPPVSSPVPPLEKPSKPNCSARSTPPHDMPASIPQSPPSNPHSALSHAASHVPSARVLTHVDSGQQSPKS